MSNDKGVVMWFKIKILVIITIFSLIGCSGITVSTDYDPNSDFSELKTFTWLSIPNLAQSHDARLANPIMDTRIKSAIEKQLQRQGFTQQELNSDFLINYNVTTEDKISIHIYNTYAGYGPGWGWKPGYGHRGARQYGYTEAITSEYQEGTLIIDVVDPNTNQLMWRGLGSKRIPSATNSKGLNKLINNIVHNVLKNFPPK